MPTKAVFTEDPNTDIRSPMEKVVFDSASKLKRQGEKPLNVKTAYTETFNQMITMGASPRLVKNQIYSLDTILYPQSDAWQYYSSMETKKLRPVRNIVFSYGILGAITIPDILIESVSTYELDIFFNCIPLFGSRITGSSNGDLLLFQIKIGVIKLTDFVETTKVWKFQVDGDVNQNNIASAIQGNIDLNRDIVGEHKDYFTDGQKTSQTMLDYFIENGDFLTFRIVYDQAIVASWPTDIRNQFNEFVLLSTRFYTTASFVYYSTSVANTLK